MQQRGFMFVKNKKDNDSNPKLPTRGTKNAMAYDFYAPKSYNVPKGETVKIWTEIKSYMQDSEGLILNVRSSMGGKFMLANTQGWVDSDFFNNPSNEGNIGVFLTNISNEDMFIEEGERIAQGMFINYLVADSGNTDNERTGGFGSTNE